MRRCPLATPLHVLPSRSAVRAFVLLLALGTCPAASAQPASAQTEGEDFHVLVFSKTEGYRHASIADGKAALVRMGRAHGFGVDTTERSGAFTADALAPYTVVVFLNTTGDVLDEEQQRAFRHFVERGGGYVGIHAASDTEYDWPWYGRLVGAYFESHPRVQPATLHVLDTTHASTRHLPARWERTDEWYNFRAPPENAHVLAVLDEATYDGGTMGERHPAAWHHTVGGGRAWYTVGGHTAASYREPLFLRHVLGGIRWAAGRADE